MADLHPFINQRIWAVWEICIIAGVRGAHTSNYSYALETMKHVYCSAWRTYNPDDTVRFHALCLQ